MALTSGSILINRYGSDQTKFANGAAAATYYPGQLLTFDSATGYLTTLDTSVDAGDVVAGVCMSQQTISSAGDLLDFERGKFAMQCKPVIALNGLAYADTDVTVTGSAGTLPLAGRYLGPAKQSGIANAGVVEIGYLKSGSLF